MERSGLGCPTNGKFSSTNASGIVARNQDDDPSRSEVFNTPLIHLIESQENLEEGRNKYPPQQVKDHYNTSVLAFRY